MFNEAKPTDSPFPARANVWMIGRDTEHNLFLNKKPKKRKAPADKFTDVFYNEMKPILYTLRFIARIPFNVKEDGSMELKVKSKWTLYTVLLYGFQTIATLQSTALVLQATSTQEGAMREFIMASFSFLFMFYHFYIIFSAWWEWPQIINYFRAWREFQVQYKNYTQTAMRVTLRKQLIIMSVLLWPYLVFVTYEEYFAFMLVHWYQAVPFVIAFLACHLYLFLWVSVCVEIQRVSSVVKSIALKVLSEQGDIGTKLLELNTAKCLWLGLSRLSRGLGDAMAATMLLICGTCAASTVVCSFTILSWIIGKLPDATSFALVLAISIAFMLIVCESAHRTTRTVGLDFYTAMLQYDVLSLDPKIRRELASFFQVMSVNQPVIELAGYVTINRGLCVSLASNIITYLIVLLQFREDI